MVNKCCVPGCSANYKKKDGTEPKNYVRSFQFPNDPQQMEKWIRKIPRENLTVTKNTVVCENHFQETDIIKFDVLPGKGDQPDIKIPRQRYKLKSDAVPSIFANLPHYLSTPPVQYRESPRSKRRKLQEKCDDRLEEFLDKDNIGSYDIFKSEFKTFISNLKPLNTNMECTILDDCAFCCRVHYDNLVQGPLIDFSVKVKRNLMIDVWQNGVKLGQKQLDWILPLKKLERWSQLENIISRYSGCVPDKESQDLLDQALLLLKEVGKNLSGPEKITFTFLTEQLTLFSSSPNRRRYSSDCIVAAYCLYITSPAAYQKLRDTYLVLPSLRYLRHLSSNVSNEKGLLTNSFLEKEVSSLNDKDRIVNLLIDEIHVKSKLSYRSGKLIGQAANNTDDLANSIQCFMIASVMSSHKMIVGMLPVKKLDSEFLLEGTKNVLRNLCSSGFNVVSVISDNNRINRKMFSLLAEGSDMKLFIYNPVDPDKKIFLLFDSVHLLKSVRNNWLNLKNRTQSFTYPAWSDESTKKASFSDLKHLYKIEKKSLLKEAPRLSWKALYPHSLERQKVSLALQVFHETNIAALKIMGPSRCDFESWEGTADFLKIICRWWDIVNVHHPYAGRNLRKDEATPISTADDSKLEWLLEMVEWLHKWREMNIKDGFISLDTYKALTHTLEGLVMLARYLLSSEGLEFILLGKFQTDNLEGRFGQYRQMSGGNTLVSVEEVLQSERKLRIKSLLEIHSLSKGNVSVKTFLTEFSSVDLSDFDDSFVANFPFEEMDIDILNDSMSVLIYVSGYVAKKMTSHTECSLCCENVGDKNRPLSVTVDQEIYKYFDDLNRGGLIYPSPVLVGVFQIALAIMNVCLGKLERDFLKLNNQKSTFIKVNREFWSDCTYSTDINTCCDNCNLSRENLYVIGLNCMANILLNNYTKSSSDACSSQRNVAKKALKFE